MHACPLLPYQPLPPTLFLTLTPTLVHSLTTNHHTLYVYLFNAHGCCQFLNYCSLLLPCGSVFVSCFVMQNLFTFWFCSYLGGEESVECCALFVFLSSWCLVVTIVLLILLVPCVGLQCVIVVYPDNTHFLLVFLSRVIAIVSS